MSLFLLDTDTVSLLQHAHPVVVRNVLAQPHAAVFICAITLQEQMKGWLGHFARLSTAKQLSDWYDRMVIRIIPVWTRFTILSFRESAILRFDSLRTQRLNVGLMDLRIAAIALDHGLTVVTRNRRDFSRVPGLTVADWSV